MGSLYRLAAVPILDPSLLMDVKGLRLPAVYVDALGQAIYPHAGVLVPVEHQDAYGHPFTTDLAAVLADEESMQRASARLAYGFEADDWYGAREAAIPGGIADIVDFSLVVWFGASSEGEPFCFDFRADQRNPSIICWDGDALYWRRIAPDFEALLAVYGLRLDPGES